MIHKVTRGETAQGLVRYLFSEGKDGREGPGNLHVNQRVVAASECVDVRHGVMLTKAEQLDLGSQLDNPQVVFGTAVNEGHVYHLSLAAAPGDGALSDERWAEIARETMGRLGFSGSDGKAPCRWVAVGHGPNGAGADHVHLAVSLVREDGTAASIWRDLTKLSAACHDFEVRYGLQVVEGRLTGGMPGLTGAELGIADRQGAEPDRVVLARRVRETSVAATSEADFVRRLHSTGVITYPHLTKGGGEVDGYRVALKPAAGEKPVWRAGGQLAKDLTLPKLREHWAEPPEARAEAMAEWTRGRPARPQEVRSAENWKAAAERVGAAVDRLQTVSADDAAAWRGAARETAGAFAAWSRQAEGDRRGPLGHAADVLARSAQVPRGQPPCRRSDPVRDLRGVTAVIGYAMVQKDSTAGWVLLAVALAKMVETIEAAHVARGEALQAQRLAAWSVEMVDWQHRLRTEPLEQLVPAGIIQEPAKAKAKIRDHPLPPPERGPGPERGFGR